MSSNSISVAEFEAAKAAWQRSWYGNPSVDAALRAALFAAAKARDDLIADIRRLSEDQNVSSELIGIRVRNELADAALTTNPKDTAPVTSNDR